MAIPVQLFPLIISEHAHSRSTGFEFEFIDNDESISVAADLDMECLNEGQIFDESVASFLDEKYVEVVVIDFEYQIYTFFLLIKKGLLEEWLVFIDIGLRFHWLSIIDWADVFINVGQKGVQNKKVELKGLFYFSFI